MIAISRETKRLCKKEFFGYNDKDITNRKIMEYLHLFATFIISGAEKMKRKLKRNLPVDKLIIGLVGSIEKRKGHDVLLNAIALLQKNFWQQFI